MASSRRQPTVTGVANMLKDHFHVSELPTISRAEAARRVHERLRRQTPLPRPQPPDQPVSRGALVDASGRRVEFPPGTGYDRCFVALADATPPETRWAHPALWVF